MTATGRRRQAWGALCLAIGGTLAMVGSAPAPGRADAPGDIVVQAGARAPGNPDAPYEYLRFYPGAVRVHRGQTIAWEFAGPAPYGGLHTVTFSEVWRQPLSFTRADEVPGTLAWDETMWRDTGCGRAGQAACVIDGGTTRVSSGVPLFDHSPFRATIDLPAGVYGYYCAVHPSMQGTVEVVPDHEDVPSQAQIDAAAEAEILAHTAAADALVADHEPASPELVDGRRVWTVLVGDSTPDNSVAVWSFMPSTLQIDAGDRVRFAIRDGVRDEVHTVSFPAEAYRGYFDDPGLGVLGFQPRCDPDGPSDGIPGSIWPWFEVACPIGEPEWVLSPWNVGGMRAPSDGVSTPLTLHDSGILAAPSAPMWLRGAPPGSGETFGSTFDAVFPNAGTFSFTCNIHLGAMRGSIEVG